MLLIFVNKMFEHLNDFSWRRVVRCLSESPDFGLPLLCNFRGMIGGQRTV